METNGKTFRCGQGSNEKSYDDENRSDATGGCKSNPTVFFLLQSNQLLPLVLRIKQCEKGHRHSILQGKRESKAFDFLDH